jgi:predicted aldo/keto reductase-like oxidoreductase
VKYRKMGSLDWEVSALGFGCMRLPTKRMNRLAVDTHEAVRIVRHGIDLGINYVDTAWFYHNGQSEKALGLALKDGYRDRVHLTTKLPTPLARKPEDFDRYLHQQLERLQTDHLDCYFLHTLDRAGFDKCKRLGYIEKMERARDEGLIRHIGFSFHDTLPVFKEIVDYYSWDVAQIQYNYMDTGLQATTEGLEYAAGKGIAVVIMEPLKGGRLANPPAEAHQLMKASEVHRTPVDWALQFLWNRPEVACVLSGMGSQRMVDENCASADRSGVGILSESEQETIQQIAEIYRRKILVPCTACSYCMPCPSGVNIPENFAALNNKQMDMNAYYRWKMNRSYHRLVRNPGQLNESKTNGRAALCTRCGKCAPKCPQHIDIPNELEKVTAAFGRQ